MTKTIQTLSLPQLVKMKKIDAMTKRPRRPTNKTSPTLMATQKRHSQFVPPKRDIDPMLARSFRVSAEINFADFPHLTLRVKKSRKGRLSLEERCSKVAEGLNNIVL